MKLGNMTLKKFLIEHKCYTKFIANLINPEIKRAVIIDEDDDRPLLDYSNFNKYVKSVNARYKDKADERGIISAFLWRVSPEAHFYWEDLHDKWIDYLKALQENLS